jgi:SAM-dependent methyltransferase
MEMTKVAAKASACRATAPDENGVVWERIPCPLCGSAKEDVLLALQSEKNDVVYRLVRCRECGLGYLNPRPDEWSISHFYPDDYEEYQPRDKSTGVGLLARRWLERLVFSHYLGDPPARTRWYEKLLAMLGGVWLRPDRDSLLGIPYHGQGRLLDFGCGSGWFLHLMQERGWRVTGMDFSAHAALQARNRFGIPVHHGSLPHPQIPAGSFDVITMGCVLEHVHDPRKIVAAAVRALVPGGRLVISVPNIESWGFRAFGPDWWPLELPRHLLHFTPATLKRLVEEQGLAVHELRMLARTSWMQRSLTFAARRGTGIQRLCSSVGRQLHVVPSLLTRWSVWRRQADCLFLVAEKPLTLSSAEPAPCLAARAA